MTIKFYSPDDVEYGCFSNFSPHGIHLDGKYWMTTEHFFQAQKFVGTDHCEAIRLARTPGDAKRIGGERSIPIRIDWDDVKDNIMRQCVLCKFETHKKIRKILLATLDAKIVENATRDNYWGCGTDGNGKNMLGKILMEVRETLRNRTIETPPLSSS